MLQQRLGVLCARLQLVAFPDGDDATIVRFAGVPPVRFSLLQGGVLLECAVASLPMVSADAAQGKSFSAGVPGGHLTAFPPDAQAEREKLCREALRLAMARTLREWGREPGPVLVLTENAVCLHQRLSSVTTAHGLSPLMDQTLFDDVLERFLNSVETWVTLLQKKRAPSNEGHVLSRFAGLWP